MRAWQANPVVVPDFARWALLTGASLAGTSALTISPVPTWAAAGQPLVLCKLGGVLEEVTVASASGSTINLASPLVNAWNSGDVLRPSFFGLFAGKLNSARPNVDTASYDISISCYPGGEPPRDIGTAWATLNGIEVFTPQPNYAASPSISDVWPVELIDYDRGRTAQFRPVDRYQRGAQYTYSLDLMLATQLEQFFDRMKGKRTAFYLPTGEKDFSLVSSGSTNFTAAGSALGADFGSTDYAAVDEGVAVYMRDGSVLYRRITDIAASGDNSVVTVDSAWSLTLADIARVSRMNLTRFDTDDMTTSWQTPLSAAAQLAFVGVKA